MFRYVDHLMRYCHGLGSQEWFIIMLAIGVLGFFCMRGFGSRIEY